MKLIIEFDTDGKLFVYKETEKHFRKVEPQRRNLQRVSLKSLSQDCEINPGEYVVADLK